MFADAHGKQFAGRLHRQQQPYAPGIAVRCGGFDDQRRRLSLQAGAVKTCGVGHAQLLVGHYLDPVVEQRVVVQRERQYLADQRQLFRFRAGSDKWRRRAVGAGHQRGEHQREHQHDRGGAHGDAQGTGIAERNFEGFAHRESSRLSLCPNTGGWVYRSISGAPIFISNTANAMPSG